MRPGSPPIRPPAPAATPPSADATAAPDAHGWIELAPGVRLRRGVFVPGSQPDGNTVVFDAPDGLVVVDTGRHPEHSAAIVELAKRLGKPIAAIVNTHWHLDRVSGNPRLRAVYPQVKVHASTAIEGALTGFLARYRKYLEETIPTIADPAAKAAQERELATIAAGRALGPDAPVTAAGERAIAGRTLRLGLEHAATAGDVWVLDPATKILVGGDLVTLPAPFLDTACPERWRETLDRLAATDFAAFVPGHGPVMTKADLDRYRTAFGGLLDCAAKPGPAPACIDGWIAAAGPLLANEDPQFTRSLLGYYVETLRGDPAARRELCGG